MSHIHSFSVSNFRIFQHDQSFDFAPITLLTGTNSAGKSSLIKALTLLGESIRQYPNLDILDFQQNPILGDFSSAINNSKEADPYIKFRLPIHLDYLPEGFVLELWYEKQPNGIGRNGRLCNFHIFKYDSDNLISLLKVSLLPATIEDGVKVQIEGWDPEDERIREAVLECYCRHFSLNLPYLKQQLCKQIEEATTKQALKEVRQIIANDENQEFRFVFPEEHYDQDMHAFLKDFYKNAESRNLHLKSKSSSILESTKNSLKEDLIFQYFPNGKPINGGLISIPTLNRNKKLDKDSIKQLWEVEKCMSDLLAEGICELVTTENIKTANLWTPPHQKHSDVSDTVFHFIIKALGMSFASTNNRHLSYCCANEHTFFGTWLIKTLTSNNIVNGLAELRNQLSMNHLGSVRGAQRRYFSEESDLNTLNHLIESFISHDVQEIKVIRNFINYWCFHFGLGDEIGIDISNTGLTKSLFVQTKGKRKNVADLGFGSCQLVPILLNIALTAAKNSNPYDEGIIYFDNSIISIEEPESNLHPALQSKLADMFIDAAYKFNIQFLLETHSEYLVRKLQYWTAKKVLEPGAVRIYYFFEPSRIPAGEEQIKRIEILHDGKLTDDFGSGFFDEADKIAIDIWDMTSAHNN